MSSDPSSLENVVLLCLFANRPLRGVPPCFANQRPNLYHHVDFSRHFETLKTHAVSHSKKGSVVAQ